MGVHRQILLLLTLGILLLPFLLRYPLLGHLLTVLLAGTMALELWRSTEVPRPLRFFCVALPSLAVALRLLPLPETEPLVALEIFCLGAFYAVAAFLMVRSFWSARDVNAETILGALAGYMLLGLVWAYAYALVELLAPGSFTGLEETWRAGAGGALLTSDGPELIYFSFVTLTTLGYGDVSPTTPMAGALAMLEAIAGQLYIAVLIARLVALSIVGATRDD